ncbi:hypothetical protein ACP70R_026321 [Stipagrostis hirtigluma subsp. patula]
MANQSTPGGRRARTDAGASPSPWAEGRIRKELQQLRVDPPPFCRPGASPVTDLFRWEAIIDGPEGSPYAGGTFPVDIKFHRDHPFKPPKITFKTKVYHPNINAKGQMVLDIFKGNWSPAMTIDKALISIVSVLNDPMLDYPVNGDIADLYESDIKLYESKARAWTLMYASTPVVSYYPQKGDEHWQDYCAAVAAHYAKNEKNEKRRRRAAAASPAGGRTMSLLWRKAVAFLQCRLVALPSTAVAVAN